MRYHPKQGQRMSQYRKFRRHQIKDSEIKQARRLGAIMEESSKRLAELMAEEIISDAKAGSGFQLLGTGRGGFAKGEFVLFAARPRTGMTINPHLDFAAIEQRFIDTVENRVNSSNKKGS